MHGFFLLVLVLVLAHTSGLGPSLGLSSNDVEKEDYINVIIVAGKLQNDAVKESKALINSILLMSTQAIHFNFLLNHAALKTVHNFRHLLKHSRVPLKITVRTLNETWVIRKCKEIQFDHTTHHAGVWGAAKLWLPWLYPNLERALVLDTDMVLSKDVAILWRLFDERNTTTGIVAEHKWIWRMPLNENHPWHVCTCVMLIEMAWARARVHITRDFLDGLHAYPVTATSKSMWRADDSDLFHSDVGDQGVLFALYRHKPDLFTTLAQTWNSDHCHKYYGVFTKRIPPPQGILHRNCIGAHIENAVDEASTFFSFFNNYPLNWHDGEYKTQYLELGSNETYIVGDLYEH